MKNDIKNTFEQIYAEYSDTIFRFCLSRVSNRGVALDITQDTFLKLWKNISEEGTIVKDSKAFLFTIARRSIIDWYRKKKSFSLESLLVSSEISIDILIGSTEDNQISDQIEGKYLLDNIKKLSVGNQETIYLRFVEDLSPTEIAEILRISPNAVSVRINRGIRELRRITGYEDNQK